MFINVRRAPRGEPYACPCCAHLTLEERGYNEICPVCFWEDDGQDDHDADEVRGGPNRRLSLTEARRNYADYGASDRPRLQNVRAPHPHERPGRMDGGIPGG
ncbi:CPCC family cysteine-rich protein [Spirillospora sp. NPDC047279]|uniref:CPCC family cysteine-rich protein n=1 Tax=Spirillospora sp. NPDC047279 TaxID=3155478 RepID=UPI0033F7CA81